MRRRPSSRSSSGMSLREGGDSRKLIMPRPYGTKVASTRSEGDWLQSAAHHNVRVRRMQSRLIEHTSNGGGCQRRRRTEHDESTRLRADGGIRTHDLTITNRLLWPTELIGVALNPTDHFDDASRRAQRTSLRLVHGNRTSRRYDGRALRSERRSPRSLTSVIDPWVQIRFDAA